MKPIELAEKLNACDEATEFVANYATIEEAWAACPRADWMLWTALMLGVDERVMVGVAGKCARTVQHLMKDPRSIAALDACDKYAAGELSERELKDVAYSAYSAYYVAARASARASARDSAHASAAYAAYAAADADYAAAKTEDRLKTANICREFLTEAVFKIINEKFN